MPFLNGLCLWQVLNVLLDTPENYYYQMAQFTKEQVARFVTQ